MGAADRPSLGVAIVPRGGSATTEKYCVRRVQRRAWLSQKNGIAECYPVRIKLA